MNKLCFFILCFIVVAGVHAGDNARLPVFGYLENVSLDGNRIQLQAKLDTGADFCSVDAREVVSYEIEGQSWVRFFMIDPSSSKMLKFKLPVKRMTRIKRHGGSSLKRYVVELEICLGTITKKREFTLADRSRYDVPILLGRNFLKDVCLVDSSAVFTMDNNHSN